MADGCCSRGTLNRRGTKERDASFLFVVLSRLGRVLVVRCRWSLLGFAVWNL